MAIKQRKQLTGTTEQIKAYAGVEGQLVWNKTKKKWVGMSGTAGTNYPMASEVDVSNLIPKTGDRGVLGGFEQITVYDDGFPDITSTSGDALSIRVRSGLSTLTFVPSENSQEASTKVIRLNAVSDCTLSIVGAEWANNADAPEWGSSGSVLVLVASFIGPQVLLSVFHNSEA